LGLLISTYRRYTAAGNVRLPFSSLIDFPSYGRAIHNIDSMPDWEQVVAYSNPLTYFIEVMRRGKLKERISGYSQTFF